MEYVIIIFNVIKIFEIIIIEKIEVCNVHSTLN